MNSLSFTSVPSVFLKRGLLKEKNYILGENIKFAWDAGDNIDSLFYALTK